MKKMLITILLTIFFPQMLIWGGNSICVSDDKKIVILPQTISRDKRYGIVKVLERELPQYHWYNLDRKCCLQSIVPKEMSGIESKLWVEVSWNKWSDKVAIIVYYGTKLSYVKVYAISPNGEFQDISFNWPKVEKIFKQKAGIDILANGTSDADEDWIGKWVDENTVNMGAGVAVSTGNRTLHYVVSFNLRIKESTGIIEGYKLSKKEGTP